ncbi:MAG: flagellin, partial [Burkholderiales bacterium]|nr:flagellin [Burkholderiales bacterium]
MTATDTARTLAGKINAASQTTGVNAVGRTVAQLAFATPDVNYSLSIVSSNNTAVNVAFSVGAVNTAQGLAGAVAAINDASSKTGVSARLNDAQDGIILENPGGDNIVITNGAGSGGGITLANFDPAGLATPNVATDDFGAAFAAAAGADAAVVGYVAFNSDRGYAIGA